MLRNLIEGARSFLGVLGLQGLAKRLLVQTGTILPLRKILAFPETRKARADHRIGLRGIEQWLDGFRDKRILEIGADGAGIVVRLLKDEFMAAEAVGVNPAFPDQDFGDRCRLLQKDAARLPYPDDHFDVAISLAAFEHVHNLEAVLQETHRVLRPGGRLFAAWGPIWTSSFGHHLWMGCGTYHDIHLPPWCHLTDSEAEIAQFLLPRHGPKKAEAIAHFALHSRDQNQKPYEEYLAILHDSPFSTIWVRGFTDHIHAPNHMRGRVLERYRLARRLHPAWKELLYDGMEALLEKPL